MSHKRRCKEKFTAKNVEDAVVAAAAAVVKYDIKK
jgi:hypothetical protein